MAADDGQAWFGGLWARDVVDVADDLAVLDRGGWWGVVVTFEGECRLWRFGRVEEAALPARLGGWAGPVAGAWRSTLGREAYEDGVREIRRRIRDGDVYQVNLCRVLAAPSAPDPWRLAGVLARGNPAPYAGVIDVPELGLARGATLPATHLVCASPELFLSRNGAVVASGPIKGTGATEADLQPKDRAENVMIVDLVRNDLQRACAAGTVAVPSLLRVERHPGLVHLVSTVQGRLREGVGWPELLAATTPPGSVSGAPKSTALTTIRDLEPTARGPYCGAIGYVDADRGTARLAVGIRTFWWEDGELRFGTGAGITWDSDPAREWAETELKAARLVGLASGDDSGQEAGHRGVEVQVEALLAVRHDGGGAVEEGADVVGARFEYGLAVGRGEGDHHELAAGTPGRPDVHVALADRRGQPGAEKIAGEDPLDLHAITGEDGADGVRVGGAVAQADR